MKINRNSLLILLTITVIVILLYIFNELYFNFDDLKAIILNVFCGCFVSIVMCLTNYFIEKRKIELNIFNQARSYYSYLSVLYVGSGISLAADFIQNPVELYNELLPDLEERNSYFFERDHELCCFFDKNKRKKAFDDVYSISIGIDLSNQVKDYLMLYDQKIYEIDEIHNFFNEYTLNQIRKLDIKISDICKKYLKEYNWEQIKKNDSMVFINNDGE